MLFFVVNDILIHPNQGELLSADQNGTIKQWVLASNECDLELVGRALCLCDRTVTYPSQAPVADVPMRSITMAHDGSFLVAGNHKVRKQTEYVRDILMWLLQGDCFVWRITDHQNPQMRYKAVHKFGAHKQYLTRCVLSPDSQYVLCVV